MWKKPRLCWLKLAIADGLTIEMTCQEPSPVPAICTIWKEQLAEAGVTVNINVVPADVYYGADNLWLEADFAVTDWGSRPYPQPYLDLAYTCTAQWNESHWCDEELDTLSAQAAKELDPAKRAEQYMQIQQHLQRARRDHRAVLRQQPVGDRSQPQGRHPHDGTWHRARSALRVFREVRLSRNDTESKVS